MRNVEVRIIELSNPCYNSKPARYLRKKPSHSFSWRILCTANPFHNMELSKD